MTANAQIFPVQQEYQPTAEPIMHAQPSDGPFLPVRPNEPPSTGMYNEPEFVPYVNDMQIFDQPDLSAYGRGPRPTEGWFGSAEVLIWAVQAPPKALIGAPGSYQVYAPGATTDNTGDAVPTTANPGFIGTQPSGIGAPVQPFDQNFQFATGGVLQSSSLDSGFLESIFTGGSRYEIGRINDGRGWFVSTFHLGAQTQDYYQSDVAINFANNPFGFVDVNGGIPGTGFGDGFDDDIDGDTYYGRDGGDRGTGTTTFANPQNGTPDPLAVGEPRLNPDLDDVVPLPSVFQSVHVTNRTALWGVEANRLWRVAIGPRGGIWELFLGPRYMSIDDTFNVTAFGPNQNTNYYLNSVGNAEWYTQVQNNVFGLQLGGRWAIQRDRWQLSLESRGIAAANWQNATQTGQFGELYLATVQGSTVVFRDNVSSDQLPHGFQSSSNDITFTPGGEFRANLKYQVFRSLYLQMGYTGIYLANVGRANKLVNYSFPDMGLTDDNEHQLIVQGFDFGIVVNR